jgi:integrase
MLPATCRSIALTVEADRLRQAAAGWPHSAPASPITRPSLTSPTPPRRSSLFATSSRCCNANSTMFGRREQVRRGGYATRREAEAARDELLERSRAERTTQTWTMASWLRYWLSTRTSIRPSTLRSYTEHVDRHLIPHLGRIRLSELTGRRIAAMSATLAAADTRYSRPPTPATLHRIRATLRSAPNAAIRDGLLRDNPARFTELPTPRRPQPQVWTNRRVDAWQRDGSRPSVAVWTAPQLATFLDFVTEDRFFAVWWLIALRGLRRGEAAGLRWVDVDLDQRVVMIDQQRIAYGPHRRGRTAQDQGEPAHHRPGPHHRRQPAHAPFIANAPNGMPPAKRGTTPATCSLPTTAHRCTRTGSPVGSATSSPDPAYHPCGCTTCATAQPPSPTKPAPT